MLCAKCNRNEATVHVTSIAVGAVEETIHLCTNCAPFPNIDSEEIDQAQIQALMAVGRKCEFCGREASSGDMRVGAGAIYWCHECGLEHARILKDLLAIEQPGLLGLSAELGLLPAIGSDPKLQDWYISAIDRATAALKNRRREDGRDKGS